MSNVSTTPIKITDRDLRILRAMLSNLKSFIDDAERSAWKAEQQDDQSRGAIKNAEVTFIVEEF